MGREVVVVVTDGRLDGSAETSPESVERLAEVFGAWERIFSGQTEWLARES